jgi:hypothetical protein
MMTYLALQLSYPKCRRGMPTQNADGGMPTRISELVDVRNVLGQLFFHKNADATTGQC